MRIALDDFGTGYSVLAHLQRLNVDVLKIDRSFVEQMGRSDRDHKIVGAITAMAHTLGMSVVGEGIETHQQLQELARLGCDEGQGFLLARPLLPWQVAELCRRARLVLFAPGPVAGWAEPCRDGCVEVTPRLGRSGGTASITAPFRSPPPGARHQCVRPR